MKAIADHGAAFVGCNVMFLEGGTRDHFLGWLAAEYPHLVNGYRELYARKYATTAYRKEVLSVFQSMRDKYGLGERERTHEHARAMEAPRVHEQAMLAWRD